MLRACRGLSGSDLRAIADLQRRAVEVDGGRLKLEWPTLWTRPSDEVNDFCVLDGERLIGFAGIYSHGGIPELAGMVDPLHRRSGIGTALLDAVRTELAARGPAHALLVCPRTPGGGAGFARSHGGTADHSEHALELQGAPADGPTLPSISLRPALPVDADRISRLLRDGFGHDDATIADRLAREDDHVAVVLGDETTGDEVTGEQVIGYLRLEFDDADREAVATGSVYGFVIDAAHRGRGIGRDVLRRCCLELIGRGAERVALEVATDNEHALALYTSLGFTHLTTEDYFRLTMTGPVRRP